MNPWYITNRSKPFNSIITSSLQEGGKMKGLWLNDIFLRTPGAHYTHVSGACKIHSFRDPKTIYLIGAVGLCATSVCK